jgi:predicted DCC family thiol-disulfide oxidoreductase YuxK
MDACAFKMSQSRNISPWQFAVFRIVFGLYLSVHFLQLAPWSAELFGADGVLPDPSLNFTFGFLPNPLEHLGTTGFVTAFVTFLAGLSLCFTLGLFRRTVAVLLWFGWACLFNRNNLISNPGIPYVGLILLLCALVPPGEPLSIIPRSGNRGWRMPAAIFWGAWLLLAAGYTYSGAWKLTSPSWTDGTALQHLLMNPLARPNWIRELLLNLPDACLRLLTWGALAGELLALPLGLTRRGRPVVWCWMLAMHLGILLVIDFADLTLGMLMIHLFTFDPNWLPAKKRYSRLVLFDGACGLCERTVRFLLNEDREGLLRFAPLQGRTAKPLLLSHKLSEAPPRSMVLIEHRGEGEERAYTRSEAFLRTLDALGGFWRAVSWLRVVPRPIRDWIYDAIALNRYRWFGVSSMCRLPERGETTRFLA